MRFQVLEKVKHENIVKLLAIEEEQEGRGKVKILKNTTKSWKGSNSKKHKQKRRRARREWFGDVMDCNGMQWWRKPKARKQNKTRLRPGIHLEELKLQPTTKYHLPNSTKQIPPTKFTEKS